MMSPHTDRLACASSDQGPRAQLWAQDRDLGLGCFLVD